MSEDIYVKGSRLAESGKVILEAETAKAAYFAVEGDSGLHHVRLMTDNTFNCTCLWGSLKGATYGALCSHVIAAVLTKAQRATVAAPRAPEAAEA